MNRLFARRKHRKSRGVAVIFTLGILGLLTVMALGFASTALLNRKIAENSSVQTYARTIARNVALPRALFALRKGVPYGKIHSTKSASNVNGDPDSSSKDFLWTLDTLLDSRKGPIIYTTTTSGTDYTTSAEWQYVYSPVKQKPTDTKFPIIGRFAYVAFPDHGRMDPSVNLGSIDADKRYGSTEKELSLPIRSTDWNTQLKGKLENPNRWQSFNEIFSFLNIADSGSDDSRNMYQDGIGMNLSPASETFWVDLNKDGKQTRNEMFLRFNMTRDWAGTEEEVNQLVGEGAEPLTLNNAGAAQSNTFIPWLKYANFSSDPNINTRMKKQIAANIIQYNMAESADTVSDVAPADWATAATGPTYAGIGRHPMLNELGFVVQIKSYLSEFPEKIGEIQYYTYTLTYYLKIDSGVELIYPFGPASSLLESTVDITGHVELDLMGFVKQAEGESSLESDMSKIVKQYKLKTNSSTLIPEGADAAAVTIDWPAAGAGETFFKMSLSGDSWLNTSAYTAAGKFWKNDQTDPNTWASGSAVKEITFTFKIQSDTSRKTDIENLIRVKSVKFCPGRVILTYGGKQRDYAELDDLTVFSGDQDVSGGPDDPPTFFSSGYEAKDPLVNHYASDWTSPATPYIEKAGGFDYQNKYPGTILSGGNESHRNHPVPAEKLLEETINGTKIQETATDPAYTASSRLSTSYIRHGQMKSLWELGFISRAEAFMTLNLAKTKIFVEPSAISDLKAGDFVDGDANILDQVKFSDTTSDDQLYKYGKVSLNSKNHRVLFQLFQNGVNWYESLRASAKEDQFETTGTASSAVCSASPCSEGSCLAHLLQARSSILPFFNRSDLLLDPNDTNFSQIPGYGSLRDEAKEPLKTAQTNLRNFLLKTSDATTLCKAEKEQYAARFMHLFSTEPVNRVYIIIVAQTIKDIGGVPAFVDWDCDGNIAESGKKDFPASAKGLKSGYVRRKLDGSGEYQPVGDKTQEKETFLPTDTTIGIYDYGADKITGETKLIVEMQKDIFTNKWRIAGYRYVD